jgi:hypothetical protein
MARIRTIKPSFWGSRPVARLSRDARLLAIGLISFADDDGRFLASTATINGYVFPNDDLPNAKVRKWIDECMATALATPDRKGREGKGREIANPSISSPVGRQLIPAAAVAGPTAMDGIWGGER